MSVPFVYVVVCSVPLSVLVRSSVRRSGVVCPSSVVCPLYTHTYMHAHTYFCTAPLRAVRTCLLPTAGRRASGCGHRLPTEAVGTFRLGALKGDLRATPNKHLGLPHETKQHVVGEET